MRILVSLAQIPFIIWVLAAVGLTYMDYRSWDETVYQPLLASNTTKQAELATAVAANKRAQEFDTQRAAKLKELQDLGDRFRETASKIPRSASIPAVLKSFADISDSIGIDIGSYRPGKESTDAFLEITPVDVDLKGTYPQVMSFLDAVANMERIVHSKTVSFYGPTRRGNSSRVSSKVSFETYAITQASLESEANGTATPPPAAAAAGATTTPAPQGTK